MSGAFRPHSAAVPDNPDADFFYLGADRQNTLLGLPHSAVHQDGLVKVNGEIGSGNSLLCRMLADRLPDNFKVVFLANPNLGAIEVVTAILADLGIEPGTSSSRPPPMYCRTIC